MGLFEERRSPSGLRSGLRKSGYAARGKTAPPLSRVYARRWADQRPHFISFKAHSDSFLGGATASPRVDDSVSDSFLEQVHLLLAFSPPSFS